VTLSAAGPRAHLAIALDLDDLDRARALAASLSGYFAVAKIGLELYSAAGPDAVRALGDLGYDVFVDLKLHDIPTTVRRASVVLGALGVRYVTVHTQGGGPMCAAAAAGLVEGAATAGVPPPIGVGVTVLTSDDPPPARVLAERAALAAASGLGGVVCAASDLEVVTAAAPGVCTVVPGIRTAGVAPDDQRRHATPAEAIARGADLLVIGRAVTGSGDPVGAAEALNAEVATALG
jgi:orotidine-5'-phosphate decarboxylase